MKWLAGSLWLWNTTNKWFVNQYGEVLAGDWILKVTQLNGECCQNLASNTESVYIGKEFNSHKITVLSHFIVSEVKMLNSCFPKAKAIQIVFANRIIVFSFGNKSMHVTFVPVPFSPPLLLILAFQSICFTCTLLSRKKSFSKNVEQSCLTVVWKTTCQRSLIHVCWCASRWHHVFVLLNSVPFGSFKTFCLALPETGVAFLQEYHSTHQFARVFFFLRSMFVLSLSLLTLFVIWHSRTARFKSVQI